MPGFMIPGSRSLAAAILIAAFMHAAPAEPDIVSVTRIWDRGQHNAFTDLIRWHDRWFCVFREGDGHIGGEGGSGSSRRTIRRAGNRSR